MLNHEDFLSVVRNTPLVSIDLVVTDADGRLLLGLRTNEPARGSWFVPGGRILKGESLEQAFARICATELGLPLQLDTARLLGVYTHLYDTNFAGAPGVSTHYVVLAYRLPLAALPAELPRAQHSSYRWWSGQEARDAGTVHPNNLPYFSPHQTDS
jgi:colanic acid biosynthesis protein WcaH